MRDRTIGQRGLDGFVDHVDDVRRPHDALVVGRDIHEELVEINVLLVMRADQIVEGMTGDCEHWLAIAFRIIQAVQ